MDQAEIVSCYSSWHNVGFFLYFCIYFFTVDCNLVNCLVTKLTKECFYKDPGNNRIVQEICFKSVFSKSATG